MDLTINSDGEKIVSSNYWDTSHAQQGLFYLSVNAGAFRLLIPDEWASTMPADFGRRHAIITRGWHEVGEMMHEIMFTRDDSSRIYHEDLYEDCVDRQFSIEEAASQDRQLILYHRNCIEMIRMPVFFRAQKYLPCLEPWQVKP